MKTPAHIKDPIVQPLFQILEEIAAGLIRIPKFQRPVVWTDEQRLELLRSVCSGWPIGSLMLWRTTIKLASFDRLGPLEIPPTQSEFGSFVLDGHQRLSTLAGALLAKPGELPADGVDDDTIWEILYDLDDEEFVMADSRQDGHHYFSLRLALDSIGRMRFQRALDAEAGEELVERSEQIANAIYGFKVPILPVVTDEIDQATRIFQKINSTGTDMSPVHMIHALTWQSDFSLTEKLADLREEVFAEKTWRTDSDALDQMIVNACKAALGLDIYEGDVDAISKRLAENPEVLDDSALYVAAAVEFLSTHCNINSFKLLPYAAIASMLAEGLRLAPEDSRDHDDDLRYWLWWTLYVELAGGSNSSRIRRATQNVRNLFRQEGANRLELMKPTTELAGIPSRFDFRHARAKVLSLRMAEWARDHGCGNAIALLNDQDSDAIQPLVMRSLLKHHQGTEKDRLGKLLSSPANRIIASRDDAKDLRDRLFSRSGYPERLAFLVPPIATPEKEDAEGWIAFFEERRKLLEALEYRFAFDQGLLAERPEMLGRLSVFEESFDREQ